MDDNQAALNYIKYLHLEGFVDIKFDPEYPNDYRFCMYREIYYKPPKDVLELITSLDDSSCDEEKF